MRATSTSPRALATARPRRPSRTSARASPRTRASPERARGSNADARGESRIDDDIDAERRRNRAIAVSAVAVGACAFVFTSGTAFEGAGGAASAAGGGLARLEAASAPLDAALESGKPTVVEFYADWCEVCKESAPMVYDVEREHARGVNFVMLNIDNARWGEEMDAYGVDGIPHLEFLDARGNSEGFIVGKFPKEVLEENVRALERGEKTLPYAKRYGAASAAKAADVVAGAPSADPRAPDPRFHG
ncbi:Thioredoxin-like fold [Ostreococcus tauri]|uniref:Thioredoxin-like fold n=2 Tax=Ostreococcus tauri TaxID=70448 RepID=A0A090N494_OSTTA|nr:Thioredoxin-like fold [Ostreococcus tauri]CEF99473.1 Thioredoxin-like fold [Ostreococcus tauri]|eukprot:XP_022839854.1 Thioredoxin-like fold [Ostreococcus tauri]